MNNKEIELVQLSDCYPNNQLSYNLREGGNKQFTEESRAKLSHSLKSGGKVAGKNNPMYGKSWKDFMTEDEILLRNKRESESHKGISPIQFMTKETYKQWKLKISKKLTGTHLSEETRRKIGLKSKGRNPYANKTPEENHASHMKGVKTFKNKPINEQQQAVQKRKQSLDNRSEDEKMKTHIKHSTSVSGEKNPAFGRKWMHLKGSSRKEDRVYVKADEQQNYLKIGYVYGFKPKNREIQYEVSSSNKDSSI